MTVFAIGRSGSRVFAGVLVATAFALGACAGVPSDSAPRVIRTVPIGGAGRQVAVKPEPNIAPRNLITDFLQANVSDAREQSSPREFLTPAARRSWSDAAVTVVDDPKVRFYDPRTSTVSVSGHVLGTVDASGVYTPTLAPTSAPSPVFVYRVVLVNGQYRIAGLRNGLLLSESDFLHYYTQRPVYYFDFTRHHLVPDPRWTSLNDPAQLANWLMAGLTSPPSEQIQNLVSTDTLPTQATARRISVEYGTVTKIEVPGSSQLKSSARDDLAEQVSATLADVVQGELEITDNGRPVRIPGEGAARFRPDALASRISPQLPPPDVYYLRRGLVYSGSGARLRGAVNNARFFLQSIAARKDPDLGTLDMAATVGSGNSARLVVGTQSGGLRETEVRGTLTRPAFAPDRAEVWVGAGPDLYAVDIDNENKTQRVSRVALQSGPAAGRIVALRLSPDGSRVALVLSSPGGAQQLYVGAVIRGPGQIRVDPLEQVTPPGIVVNDVAWAEPLKLLAIGYGTSSIDQHVYDVGVDGSGLSSQGIGNLPGGPTTLTVAPNRRPAWVTANKSVWEQGALPENWLSPGVSSTTEGYGAVYLE